MKLVIANDSHGNHVPNCIFSAVQSLLDGASSVIVRSYDMSKRYAVKLGSPLPGTVPDGVASVRYTPAGYDEWSTAIYVRLNDQWTIGNTWYSVARNRITT